MTDVDPRFRKLNHLILGLGQAAQEVLKNPTYDTAKVFHEAGQAAEGQFPDYVDLVGADLWKRANLQAVRAIVVATKAAKA